MASLELRDVYTTRCFLRLQSYTSVRLYRDNTILAMYWLYDAQQNVFILDVYIDLWSKFETEDDGYLKNTLTVRLRYLKLAGFRHYSILSDAVHIFRPLVWGKRKWLIWRQGSLDGTSDHTQYITLFCNLSQTNNCSQKT